MEIFFTLPAAGELSGEVTELLHSQDNAGLRNAAVDILTRLGQQAIPCLLGELTCNDHDVRKFVLDILGAIGDSTVVDSMLPALHDEDRNVRAAAAENLGKLRDSSAIPALLEALGEDDLLLRFTILEALGEIGTSVSMTPLLALGKDPLLRKALFDCLGRIGRVDALPQLLSGLLDDMGNVRAAAALALWRIGGRNPSEFYRELTKLADDKHADALAGQLQSSDREVKRAAVDLLGWCGRERHAEPLLDLIDDDALRESALGSMITMGKGATCSLGGLWPGADLRRRTYLAYIIGQAGCSREKPLLVAGLTSEDPQLRHVCARGLGEIGGPEDLVPLLGSLQDESEEVREAVIKALCDISVSCREEALSALRPMLENPAEVLRVAAVTILGRLDGPEIGPVLGFALKDESAQVRRAAVRAIEEMAAAEQVPSLLMALTDEDTEVRRLAAEALGCGKEPQAVKALDLALQDEDLWVRAAAVRSLGRLGGDEALATIHRALADPVGLVVIAALEMLAEGDSAAAYEKAITALNHGDEEVVNAAIKVLAASGRCDWLAEAAERLLHHHHWEVRINFARALAELQGEGCFSLVESRLLVEDQNLVREQLQDLLTQLRQTQR